MTRREFLYLVGQVGGSAAVYQAMGALDLINLDPPSRMDVSRGGFERGKSVLILGGGLAGMCAAYEFGKLGYHCTVLEATKRAGGRCMTIRRGNKLTETTGETQTCDFDRGLYLNVGPARIPGHHVTLDYCRELGVAIEPFVNENESAYYLNTNGPYAGHKIRARAAKTDTLGFTTELLVKALNKEALDETMTLDEQRQLARFLGGGIGLARDGKYHGHEARGFKVLPGAGLQQGELEPPLEMKKLFETGYWYDGFYRQVEQQAPLFQVVGGMDRLADAFARRIGTRLRTGVVVKEIRQSDSSVRIVVSENGGAAKELVADYCVCTLPLTVLRSIPSDFAPEFQQAVAGAWYMHTGKIGLQFKRRFWEEDDRIFGGISWTDQNIQQIIYPSTGFLGKKGIVVGYYSWGEDAEALGKRPHAERLAMAMEQGAKLHPQYPDNLEKSFSVYWPQVPHQLGGWAEWMTTRNGRGPRYELLNKPQGRVYLAGEHLSYMTGWMAGALESARLTVRAIHERAAKEVSA